MSDNERVDQFMKEMADLAKFCYAQIPEGERSHPVAMCGALTSYLSLLVEKGELPLLSELDPGGASALSAVEKKGMN